MAQSVKSPTLGFGSSGDPQSHEIESHLGSVLNVEPAWHSASLSLCPSFGSHVCMLALSQTYIRKCIYINKKKDVLKQTECGGLCSATMRESWGITEMPVKSPDIFLPLNQSWKCLSLPSWCLRKTNPYFSSHLQTDPPSFAYIPMDTASSMGTRACCKVGLSHSSAVWLGEVTSPLWALAKSSKYASCILFGLEQFPRLGRSKSFSWSHIVAVLVRGPSFVFFLSLVPLVPIPTPILCRATTLMRLICRFSLAYVLAKWSLAWSLSSHHGIVF